MSTTAGRRSGVSPPSTKKRKGFTMPTTNTTVKTYRGRKVMGARIDNDDIGVLERYLERRGMTFSQWVNEKIGEIGKEGERGSEKVSKVSDELGISEEEYEDLRNIVILSGGDFKTFFKDLYDKLEDYTIELEGGKIKV